MKKTLKYISILGLVLVIFLLISYYFIPVNGVTYDMQSTIESIELDQNTTVGDIILKLAGVDGEVSWSKEENDYFVSISHGDATDRIKFSYNPNTDYILLSGFYSSDGSGLYSSDGNECEGVNQAPICLGFAIMKESMRGFVPKNQIEKNNNKPRFGKLEIKELNNDGMNSAVVILLNNKEIYNYEKQGDIDSVAVEIEAIYNLQDEDIYIIGNSSGGTACPRLYKIISVKSDLSYYASNSFGTCSDLFEKFVKNLTNDSIEITMPRNDGKNIKFLYKDHNVQESKAAR
jgi:hypothetical protein